MPGGRPKEKVSDKVDYIQVEKFAELGLIDWEIGYLLGYSERTIDRWKAGDAQFMAALKRGKAKADTEVAKSLYKRAIGFEFDEETFENIVIEGQSKPAIKVRTIKKLIVPDTTAQIFWLKNRQPDRWRDKQEIEHSGAIKTISEVTQFKIKPRG